MPGPGLSFGGEVGLEYFIIIDQQAPGRWHAGPVLSEGSDFVFYVEDREVEQFTDEQPRRAWILQRPSLINDGEVNPLSDGQMAPNTNDLYPSIPPGGEVVMFVNRPSDNSSIGDVTIMETNTQGARLRRAVSLNATMPDWQ